MNVLEDVDLLQFIGTQESQFISPLSDFDESIVNRLNTGITVYGDELPWHKTHDLFRFRPHEVTLWAGINGHGKSMVISHVMAHLMKTSRCILASLEMHIDALGERLVKQIGGTGIPTAMYAKDILQWTKNHALVDDKDSLRQLIFHHGICIYH